MPTRRSDGKGRDSKLKPAKCVPKAAQPGILAAGEVEQAIVRFGAASGSDRYTAGKSLIATAIAAPLQVYPHFHRFVEFLGCEQKVIRWNAIRILSHLAPVDANGLLDRILDAYLAPIQQPTMITAAHTIRGAARIAQAKPHLLVQIVPALVGVQSATYETAECRNVAIGHALDALKVLWPSVRNDPTVVDFVRKQTGNSRASAAKRAKALLAKR